jgi:two-component system, NarL family, nitrate/nitrite response regulator NarL
MSISEVKERMFESSMKPVLVCDTQPVAIEGIRGLLSGCLDLRFAGAVSHLDAAFELAGAIRPAAVILDKYLGAQAIIDWLLRFAAGGMEPAVVVYGAGISESEALRFLQAGAKGVLRRSSEPEMLLTCLRAVTSGNTFLEDGIFGDSDKVHNRRSSLTPRETEITKLVEQGLRNRDIARNLGIQTGTVKIHLKHIFEKTGVRGRYGLALNGLREKGTLALTPC